MKVRTDSYGMVGAVAVCGELFAVCLHLRHYVRGQGLVERVEIVEDHFVAQEHIVVRDLLHRLPVQRQIAQHVADAGEFRQQRQQASPD